MSLRLEVYVAVFQAFLESYRHFSPVLYAHNQ
jgi:hypothetical protein